MNDLGIDVDAVRAALGAALEHAHTRSADEVLAEFGWRDLLAADPDIAATVVFSLLGSTGRWANVLGDVLTHRLGDAAPQPAVAAVVSDSPLMTAPAGIVDGDTVTWFGSVVMTRDAPCTAPAVMGAVRDARGTVTVAVTDATGFGPVSTIDGDLVAWQSVGPKPLISLHDNGRARGDAVHDWSSGVALARRALAHALVAIADSALTLAVDHARDRVQFGRAIGSFQAVQHRLAEAKVTLEGARSLVHAATADDSIASLAAKAAAGGAAIAVTQAAQQVLGGIGFTGEHPLHRLVKRALLLDQLLGSSVKLRPVIGQELRARPDVYRFIEL
jgi:hypothetical protein